MLKMMYSIFFTFHQGRTSVRNASSQDCEAAKAVIIQQTSRHQKPLKVLVMHSSVVSHQTFALKIMEWLIQISSTLGKKSL